MIRLLFLLFISVQLSAQDKERDSAEKFFPFTLPEKDSLKKMIHRFPEFRQKNSFKMPTALVRPEHYKMPLYHWPDSIDYKIKILPVPDGIVFKPEQRKRKLK